MLTFSLTPAGLNTVVVTMPQFVDEMPVSAGAVFVYALVIGSIILVLYFGLKKPKGPGGVGHA